MIVLGTATISGSVVTIASPVGGFGGVKAVRMSNYTGDLLVMGDITGDSPGSQQYILPFQQNVYQVHNVRQPPSVTAMGLGTNFDTASLLIEWSTEPIIDFPGIYPCALTEAALLATGNKAYNVRATSAAGAPVLAYKGQMFLTVPPTLSTVVLLVPVNDQRLDATIVNEGTTVLKYSSLGGFAANAFTTLFPGDGATYAGSAATVSNGSFIEVHGDFTNAGTAVSIFGDASF